MYSLFVNRKTFWQQKSRACRPSGLRESIYFRSNDCWKCFCLLLPYLCQMYIDEYRL